MSLFGSKVSVILTGNSGEKGKRCDQRNSWLMS